MTEEIVGPEVIGSATANAVEPEKLERLLQAVTGAIDRVSHTAQTGLVNMLIGAGIVIAIVALGLRAVPGFNLGDVDVAVGVFFSFGLVVVAVVMRYLEYRSGIELMRHQIWQEQQFTKARIDELTQTRPEIKQPLMDPAARQAGPG